MSDDFGYLNARIRSRRSRLLPEGFFREALDFSFTEMLKVLGESIYGAGLTGGRLGDIDRAVALHLEAEIGDLPRLVSGEAREAVRLLLLRADLDNVKTIVRAKAAGWKREDVMERLGAGTLPMSLYGLMVDAPDAAALAQLLSVPGHPLARALREAPSAAGQAREWETTLDHAFFTATLRCARSLDQPYLADFLSVEVDALNLATGFKLSIAGYEGPAGRFFLNGGNCVSGTLFTRLAGGEIAVLEELGGTDFKAAAEARDLAGLEKALRCILLAKAGQGGKDALGAGLVIDYLQRKNWEAGRIRLLARRAYYQLPRAPVEREIFCP
ncbi:MAG: V-type ATPase subunit [Desulfosarcinaceae bacterium]